jgi:3-hydroxyisobutyrate dehydrogenase-like beta-hydroxyacid dehydrogenase
MPRLVDKEETMTTIGFVGLGNMGSGIASNLMAGGHEIVAWNRSPGKVDDLVAKGARRAASAGAAFDAEVVFSMLADDAAIEAVIVASGALDAARPGATHVNLSTISISLARRLEALHRERGLGYVAAPVLGRPDAAAAGQLVILPAGDPAAVEKVRPLLELFARRVWPVGDEAYRANVIKLGCNFALAAMIETLGEAGALAAAHGVDPKDLFAVMTETLFAAPAYKTYAALIGERRFSPAGFAMPLGLKDVRLALQAGEEKHASLPIGSLLRDRFLEAIAHGDGELDWSALSLVSRRAAGLEA